MTETNPTTNFIQVQNPIWELYSININSDEKSYTYVKYDYENKKSTYFHRFIDDDDTEMIQEESFDMGLDFCATDYECDLNNTHNNKKIYLAKTSYEDDMELVGALPNLSDHIYEVIANDHITKKNRYEDAVNRLKF